MKWMNPPDLITTVGISSFQINIDIVNHVYIYVILLHQLFHVIPAAFGDKIADNALSETLKLAS